ncbi:hypothetical protein [Streptomyces poonensis]|uniref:hypothetical protein n=1 Tax=Streptomyces poonensis TaxID=68255 RepID=UPI0027E52F5E|nr:hypothetical protein [Streptomyces poonensis]
MSSGPRHAALRKPLLARLQVPAGKAMALAAMPTAVLMGIGFAPALARADDKATTTRDWTVEEYQACVEVLEAAEDGKADENDQDDDKDTEATASPSPSASTEAPAPGGGEEEQNSSDKPATGDNSPGSGSSDGSGSPDNGSSSDSGSDDGTGSGTGSSEDTADAKTQAPALPDAGDVLGTIGDIGKGLGDAVEDLLTPGQKESASATPSPSASASTPADEDTQDQDGGNTGKDATKDTAGPAPESEPESAKSDEPADEATEPSDDATASSSPAVTPSPSESSTVDPDDCPVATDEEGGLEEGIPALPDDPWYLDASSLLLKGARYEGIVKVKTASGTVKEVLKYVVTKGTDIGDLHQTVEDKRIGKTYHVQAGEGTTSTIRDGDTVMYTESISGKLLGLIPVTFDPENPPPLDIPIIYFTDVRVVQAGQFGGTLHIPGLHQYID